MVTVTASVVAPLSGGSAQAAAGPAVPVRHGAVVSSATNWGRSAPLSQLQHRPSGNQGRQQGYAAKPLKRANQGRVSTSGASPTTAANAPTTLTSFNGVGNGFSGPQGTYSVNSAPPDTNLAAGPNHIVEIVNSAFAVFNKSGIVLEGPLPINTLWSGFGGLCETHNDGDPIVTYDRGADRWVITQFAISGATSDNLQCVAVSTSGDPTGTYNRYSFSNGTNFPDYPKLSVWPDAYYITYNYFNQAGTAFLGGEVCALDRTQMLAGTPATQQCFNVGNNFGGLLTANLDGSTAPPAGSPEHVLSLALQDSQLAYWKFHVDWTTPANTTLTGPAILATAPFTEPCGDTGGTCVPQVGTTQQLDTLGDRLMQRLAYRNFGDHEALVVNHSVTAGSSIGVRWYELRPGGGSPSIFQQGTYAPDANYRWMGSIAQDQSGDMGLGFSIGGPTIYPGIHYTGRLASDAAGTMAQGEGTIIDGGGSQAGNFPLARWGDYSGMSIDPSDDCTFWYANEYLASTGEFNWSTRIGSFKFPSCGAAVTSDFSISASPGSDSVTQGGSTTSTISTAVTAGSAQTVDLSASGAPTGASVSFNPASITSGGSSTMTVNTGSAAAGTYTITVTGTGTSANHSTGYSLTINAPVPNDFSLSVSPASGSANQGGSATSTITTAVTSGSAQSVSLSSAGAPSGATIGFSPASVTAGGSSTMTVNSGTAVAGTYTITVTGTGSSATHSTSYALTVVANDFSISASPSSGSAIQGGSATSTISTTVTSGSAQTVSLSSSGAPSGASVSFSPASVTAGGSSTMTVNAGSAAAGTYTITITGAGTSANHSTGYSLTINAPVPNDFSISVSPASGSANQGGSATSTITTAVTSGSAQSVSLSSAGAPSGASISFSPASVTAGGSSTMTVNAGTPAAGSYTITITGTAPSGTHATTYSLTVTAAGGIVNGGFETGNFTGWTRSGTTAISTVAHGGTYSAMVGGSSRTNGVSSVAQTFTAPSGTGQLSFWFQVHCPDTVTYDWATATLTDAGTGTISTVLNRTCTNNGRWVQAAAPLTAGHSYTLTLISRDDNSPGDPTYTLYDDVSLTPAPPPPPVGITNGGFEAGSFTGWTRSGVATSITAVAHTGSFAAMLGSTSPTNGDSSISQSFTAGAGSTSLSLYYANKCPDTVTYDWVTVTLKDTTAGTTAVVVSKTCASINAWTHVNAAVVTGHTYTLTLTSHDDNFSGDPTYTLFDDIALL